MLLNMVNLIGATMDVVKIVRIVCIALLAVCAIAITVLVLIQPAASEGMGALNGQSYDSFFSKNKARTSEGVMKRLTIVFGVLTALLALAFFLTYIWID